MKELLKGARSWCIDSSSGLACFLCSPPDGTLLDKRQFLEHTAKPRTAASGSLLRRT